MQLNSYQRNVLADLDRYLELYVETSSPAKAYNALWQEKGVPVGLNGMDPYRDILSGVPHVCAKIPTGGGKTFLAASAVKTIFSRIPMEQARPRAVVWLVPSDPILSQTWNALSDVRHPYRERLDVDFSGAVQVYSKEQALTGQNLKPGDVQSNLSVFVLSYDSFRTSKKEGRKAYQQNGYLNDFAKWVKREPSAMLPDTDETALIQVIRSFNPVVIVDESHHAVSDLSVEMLKNFNPCFVFDLTATPRKNSAVISFVDAVALKKENMVKLPVIVYNRRSQQDVYGDAISIRDKLEAQAQMDEELTGRYIRPIVLFQAQPKGTPDSTTYEKIKKTLTDAGIPEEEIAIRTGDRNELKNVDLRSRDCPIRYIITVNALKEGWDCPFAYVLATVANRTSLVDVEQILGRVLRLPEAKVNL
ncbi:MAG: DEAD/DEAH box helicase family protein [Oscillibacter sp.]|nr:DEAD/DEAH box helicase family protein [Oscillibacter sp.]